ncbi:MAG TPA: ubiquinone/menaquinone biosynthesis methyltransferase [Gemmatimonadaceae bacterium]|nr:ubiquinone/menaquinone biosynthesis methyltransferase [Gemmatimonadaceae bacterium]
MPRLRDLDLARHLADPAIKQRFVTPMFDLVAPRYDEFTRAFSFGMDRRWKRVLVSELASRTAPGARVLDLACGTGDLAFAAAAVVPGARVTGVDASGRMIELARGRARGAPAPVFVEGDMAHLSLGDSSVDAVTAGYAFRNAPDHRAALAEAGRVLRPGGLLITLDFFRPRSQFWRFLFLSYLRAAGNAAGWWWHREPVAYGYIAPSIDAFVSWQHFSADLMAAGFDVLRVHTWLLSGVCMHIAHRSEAPVRERR